MNELNLILLAMLFMFTISIIMMVSDYCDYSVVDKMEENKRFEKRWMRKTIREMGRAMNQ